MPSNFGALAQAMRRRKSDLPRVMAEATKEATELLWKQSKLRLNRMVYGRPIPKRGSGKPKWRRTQKLRGAERYVVRGAEGFLHNRAKAKRGGGGYAHARHNLGLTGGDELVIPPPPSKKRKTTRKAPWRAQAIADTRRARPRIYRKHLTAMLRRTAVKR